MTIDERFDDLIDIEPGRFGVERGNDTVPQHGWRDGTDIFRRHMAPLVQQRRALPAMSKAMLARGPAPY